MQTLLVPYDGSDHAQRALRYAGALAQSRPGMQLALLHVLDPMQFRNPATALGEDELARRAASQLAEVLRPARDALDARDIGYQTHGRTGDPAREIVAVAAELGCDRIVMGTRGMGAFSNVVIGSVANRVVQLADVPVTLVK